MCNVKLTKSQKVILYIIEKLGKWIEGRKKLMKLMFLVEHYDPEKEKLTKKQCIGNEFIIYHFGVFSFDVMNDYISLLQRGIIDEYPIKLKGNIEIEIDEEVKKRVDKILSKFKTKWGFELEKDTLKMLNLSKETKMDFFGKNVKELIKE